MKNIFFIVYLFVLLLSNIQAYEITDSQSAINIAGKQRMLTQRMLLNYAASGMHIKFKSPEKNLIENIELFEKGLSAISKYSDRKDIKSILSKEYNIWYEIKPLLLDKPDKDISLELYAQLDKLLNYSNNIVQVIKKNNKIASSKFIDISGRQRMLSQRIAGLYILNLWTGKNISLHKDKLKKAMALFKKSTKTLKNYYKNTPKIMSLIANSEKSYKYFEIMESLEISMDTMPTLVYKKMDEMLNYMDKATYLYTKIYLDQSASNGKIAY